MKLGPYSVSIGLDESILRNNGPFPSIQDRVRTNGLVIELARHARLSKYSDSVVSEWLSKLGVDDDLESINSAVWQLNDTRNNLRKRKARADIAILESSQFRVSDWPLPLSNEPQNNTEDVTSIETTKENNLLQYEIAKKEKHISTLEGKIVDAKETLSGVKSEIGHYSARNVNRRDQRYKKCRNNLQDSERKCKDLDQLVEALKKERDNFKSKYESLLEEVDSLRGEVEKEERNASKHKTKASNLRRRLLRLATRKKKPTETSAACKTCKELRRQLSESEKQRADLELKRNENTFEMCELKSQDGAYSTPVRVCVCELIGLEVSAENVPKVIQSVSRHFYKNQIQLRDLPCRNTCINMANEGAEIIRSAFAQKLEETTAWGLHKDGTTRKKRKILDSSITLSTGENFSLGFSSAASETGQAIMDDVVRKITELSAHSDNPQNFVSSVASSMAFFMNDRAANEKKSNQLLSEWRDSMLKKFPECKTELHHFYCMAHVLLGFHAYVLKELEAHQKAVSTDGSGIIGRDVAKQKISFKGLQAASRVCKSASDVFAPNGDYRGLRDVWEAYCIQKNIKSTICNYRDNRFNGLFAVAASIVHHHQDFLHILSNTSQDNAVIRGLRADLQDEHLMKILHALALVYVKVTDPYWNMVTSSTYISVIQPVKTLYQELLNSLSQPELLTTPKPLICLEPWTSTCWLDRLATWKSEDNSLALKAVIKGLIACFDKQLKDMLSTDTTLSSMENVAFAPSTNLCAERNFGDLDASQRRRPHASLHYHSSFVNLKKHHPRLATHVSSMSSRDQQLFFIRMRYHAKKSKLLHKEHDAEVGQAILQKINTEKAVKKAKKTVSVKKAKKPVSKKKAPKHHVPPPPQLADINVGIWIAVSFHDAWYPGIVRSISESAVAVDFAYPCKSFGDFKWPDGKDIQSVSRDFIIAVDLPTSVRANGRFFHVENHKELTKIHKTFVKRK